MISVTHFSGIFNIGVTATDSSTLGAYQVESAASATALVNTAASANTAINALVTASADYTVSGSFGSTSVIVYAGSDA